MNADEFRRHGHAVVDWIARYMEEVDRYPVLSPVEPGQVRGRLAQRPPDRGEPFERILADVDDILMPGITHWQSPNFFAYFPANNSGPSILGELLSAGLGVQGMLWATSPACTELETHVLDWLVEMLDLPEGFLSTGAGGGVIQDTASSALLCALLAARERATGFDSNRHGVRQPLTVYGSTETHSSLDKAVRIAGIGHDHLRKVAVDGDRSMRPDLLEREIEADRDAGRVPCFVCATLGTTSTLGVDPLRAIGEVCRRHDLWLHVDAAMAGAAALCPEFRPLQDGLELADSYCFNPHKWMLVNFDCDCFFVRDRQALTRTLGILPAYLENEPSRSGEVIDYRDWQIPLGRRFRALKLWFVIRSFGVEGLRRMIREHVALAGQFADLVRGERRFELSAPVSLNLVCFRLRSGDDSNQALLDRVNRSGEMYLTHARIDGRLVLRMAIGQAKTQRRHVEQAWRLLCRAADTLDSQ